MSPCSKTSALNTESEFEQTAIFSGRLSVLLRLTVSTGGCCPLPVGRLGKGAEKQVLDAWYQWEASRKPCVTKSFCKVREPPGL